MNDETPFNSLSLSGRRTLVTGASSDLGLAITQDYARMGTKLIVTGCGQACLDGCLTTLQLTPELPCHAVQADLRVAEERAAMVAAIDSEVHRLVHSVGISRLCPVRVMTEVHLREVQSISVDSSMLFTQALLKRNLVAPGGSTLFIVSIAAHIGVAGVGAYSGTKVALIAVSRCLAIGVVKHNIRVNCLSPSLIGTPLLDATTQMVGLMGDQRSSHPMGFDKPEGIASAAIFMLSDASCWATGTILMMNGGLAVS